MYDREKNKGYITVSVHEQAQQKNTCLKVFDFVIYRDLVYVKTLKPVQLVNTGNTFYTHLLLMYFISVSSTICSHLRTTSTCRNNSSVFYIRIHNYCKYIILCITCVNHMEPLYYYCLTYKITISK